ncbi:exo-alpha-sialidase [Marinilabiliaceae bacterium JC017]|nr:exo-alpha-sialidase [Marinilabiliaceae bacterium JC017]
MGCTTMYSRHNTETIMVHPQNIPVFGEKAFNNICSIDIVTKDSLKELSTFTIHLADTPSRKEITALKLVYNGTTEESDLNIEFGQLKIDGTRVTIKGTLPLTAGENHFSLLIAVNKTIDISQEITIEGFEYQLADGTSASNHFSVHPLIWRIGKVVRAAGQDQCDTYRIPGLVTTTKGTLIAVYDNRYNNSKDLQEDINIGMSRSTDGGQTWEPMKVIMDMGEWGGLPQQLNGVGDPCVLYDYHNHTIWVVALWIHGLDKTQMAWWGSKPGLKPGETGQLLLVNSTDDGLTWSGPINITKQIKDPAWQLLLQGPGKGICMKNGTLVFPAQYKKDIGKKSLDGGQYTCHSTIIYSQDAGKNWNIGSGAKTNTTEAQVAELSDGSLMLNMRDDRNRKDKGENNGRAVAVTSDLGKTWRIHPSSNSALPEPNCMASLISTSVKVNGTKQNVLFFSNPNNKHQRTNMTIKASLDQGLTWPAKFHAEINQAGGFGYSCLTMVDEETIGILYEGVKDLYFQQIPVEEIIHAVD